MRMGNLLGGETHTSTMATRQHSVGIDHVTVVPKPATPAEETADDCGCEACGCATEDDA